MTHETDVYLQGVEIDPHEIVATIAAQKGWDLFSYQDGEVLTIPRKIADASSLGGDCLIKFTVMPTGKLWFSAEMTLPVEPEKKSMFMDMLNRINNVWDSGAFIYVTPEGTDEEWLRFRDSLALSEGVEDPSEDIERMLDEVYDTFAQFVVAFQNVAWTDEDIEESLSYLEEKIHGTA